MTENLLQKVEDKILNLVDELGSLQKEIIALKDENNFLKEEQVRYTAKLKSLVSLLDVLDLKEEISADETLSFFKEEFSAS